MLNKMLKDEDALATTIEGMTGTVEMGRQLLTALTTGK